MSRLRSFGGTLIFLDRARDGCLLVRYVVDDAHELRGHDTLPLKYATTFRKRYAAILEKLYRKLTTHLQILTRMYEIRNGTNRAHGFIIRATAESRCHNKHTEITMRRKKMLIAIAAVALGIAGAVSSAQAGNDKYDDGDGQGGIKTGPLGQRFDSPYASGTFASAPLTTKQVRGKKQGRANQAPTHED